MEVFERRNRLSVQENPDKRLDYVTSLSGEMAGPSGGAPVSIELRYVPDRSILEPASFVAYLAYLAERPWPSLETLAAAILDDINNEVVARWVQVTVECRADSSEAPREHRVFLQDRQPNWDNPELLARLERH